MNSCLYLRAHLVVDLKKLLPVFLYTPTPYRSSISAHTPEKKCFYKVGGVEILGLLLDHLQTLQKCGGSR